VALKEEGRTFHRFVKQKLSLAYVWPRLLLAAGLLLGLLLLVHSIVTYSHVTGIMVTAELRRDALRQALSLEREGRQAGVRNAADMKQILDEHRLDLPERYAWIRIFDTTGRVLAQSGNAVGTPLAPQRPPQDFEPPAGQVRETDAGKVLAIVLPLRLVRGPPPEDAAPAARAPRQFIEIALYRDSTSATFGRLGANLMVSASAALGLVAAMAFLWVRLPHYVLGRQLERQTELARQVQRDLLPAANVSFESLDFAAACVPAQQVGGDFYDVFADSRGYIAMVLGDVSGKGLPASVVVGLLLGAVRASRWMAGAVEHEASSKRLSELLRTRTSLERFASLFWCYYDPEPQRVRYVNAGHLPPMLVTRNNAGELAVQRLTEGGPVLGLLEAAGYRQGEATVRPGDLLVLYSDGVVEAENAAGEQFNEDRLLAVIRENMGRPAAAVRDSILDQVKAFLDEGPAQDDLTVVVAMIREQPARPGGRGECHE
jgi:hypothetical protein